MNAADCLRLRRSCRKFTAEPVSRDTLREIVELARYAPSWKNTQIARYTVIDDTYNANPTSMKASLDVLKQCSGRRVAILGDMRELGEAAPQMHEDIGRYAVSLGIERILCVGKESERMYLGAQEEKPGAATYFATQEDLLAQLQELIRDGDVILVKASRGMYLEQTVERLLSLANV